MGLEWGWKAWQHHWELAQASSGTKVPVGTQPKRQNPSRIQAQRRAIWSAGPLSPVSTQPKRQNPSKIQAKRVANWSAEPVPFGTFEPAKSKDGWDWNAWQHHWELAQASSGTKVPVGTQPKRQNPARFRPNGSHMIVFDRFAWKLRMVTANVTDLAQLMCGGDLHPAETSAV